MLASIGTCGPMIVNRLMSNGVSARLTIFRRGALPVLLRKDVVRIGKREQHRLVERAPSSVADRGETLSEISISEPSLRSRTVS